MTVPARSAAAIPGDSRAPDTDVLPASSRQDWCWHWVRCYTEDSAPLEAEVLLLRGRLDVGALRDALADVEMRHDALRLHLAGDEGTVEDATWPGQRLRPTPSGLHVVAAGSGRERAEMTHTLGQRLDLTDRMVRTTLVRSADGEHLLVAQFHHLAVDATSHDVFRRDLAAAYAARTEPGRGAPADGPAPFSYVDMIRQEQSPQARVDRQRRAADLARTLRAHGAEEPIPARPDAEVSLRAQSIGVPLTLSADRTETLLRWCRERRTTPHNALLALLARGVAEAYERDRLVATVFMHGRTTPAARKAVGLLCNVMHVPLDIGDRGLSGLARQVGDRMLAAWDGVDLPLSAVVDNTTARVGTEAVFRTALSHLAFDMTGGAGRRISDASAPLPFGPALSAQNVTYEPSYHRQRFAGRRQALQCARTLYATAQMTESGITGSLRVDERYHDPERLARVADVFHASIDALPAG
ncbi:condensation domain-containing protein [Streptomyces phaeoluteigriseus]|uniref:Condensation domain-containing protein n=1 Tax=Streptomyces phaeoluteigriseus TaxID=114686 RepID=A0ABY4ZBF6_9ACTN|nr:condensation domain-containing protein [Streptomyces phaeoluteigriseus]USQ86222.1 condensation domain-containing protein [Streptomyces phaeoluteigriseus]